MNELTKLRKALSLNARDLLLFELTLITTAPVKDILNLKLDDLNSLKPNQPFSINIELNYQSTSIFSQQAYDALQALLADSENNLTHSSYLFQSKQSNKQLSITSASRIMKKWWETIDQKEIQSLPNLRNKYQTVSKKMLPDNNKFKLSKHNSVQTEVYNSIEQAILSGYIQPGEKIITESLASELSVSRIPVREAIGRLEARGLISTRPKWGSIVKKLSKSELFEILELRLDLETKAAIKASHRLNDEFENNLYEAQSKYANARKTSETDLLLSTNRNFHFTIYKNANAPVLLEMINQLWDKVSPYYHLLFRQTIDKSPMVGVEYHQFIIESIINKDKLMIIYWLNKDLKESANYMYELFKESTL